MIPLAAGTAALLVIVLLVVLMSGGGDVTATPRPSSTSRTTEAPRATVTAQSDELAVTLRTDDGFIEIRAPRGWTAETSEADNGPDEPSTLIAESADGSELVSVGLTALSVALDLGTSAKDNAKAVAAGLGGDADISAPLSTRIDGHEAVQYEVRGVDSSGTGVVYLLTLLFTQRYAAQMLSLADTFTFKAARDRLYAIAASMNVP